MERDCCFTDGNRRFRYRAAAVIIEDDCLLVITNEKADYYYSVGGGVHMGETSEDAVKREVFEETGVNYQVDRLLFVNENFFTDNLLAETPECHEVSFYYLMKPRGTKELPENTSTCCFGKEKLKWVKLSELEQCNLLPGFLKKAVLDLPKSTTRIVTID